MYTFAMIVNHDANWLSTCASWTEASYWVSTEGSGVAWLHMRA